MLNILMPVVLGGRGGSGFLRPFISSNETKFWNKPVFFWEKWDFSRKWHSFNNVVIIYTRFLFVYFDANLDTSLPLYIGQWTEWTYYTTTSTTLDNGQNGNVIPLPVYIGQWTEWTCYTPTSITLDNGQIGHVICQKICQNLKISRQGKAGLPN